MPPKKILVVEDNELNRDLFVQLLSEAYSVVLAADGQEGIKKAEEEKPDLILMDFGMPVMDGWAATKRIKADPALAHIPVIAVTSHAMVGDEQRAREVGCDDYTTKPIQEDELIAKIKKFIG